MNFLQQGKFAEAEVASRLLWGKANKFEETIGDLNVESSQATEEDATWGELLSKRYWKGLHSLIPFKLGHVIYPY